MVCKSYAYYRLPYADTYTLLESGRDALVLGRLEDLGNIPGFAIVPFLRKEATPALLITPERITTCSLTDGADSSLANEAVCGDDFSPSEQYRKAFDRFHAAVDSALFRKLVLARSKHVPLRMKLELSDPSAVRVLFEKACRMYPRLMIMLYSTSVSGTWIVASPEILVDGKGRRLHTVAIAGTMPFREGIVDWSGKNRSEQHIVEEYIEGLISNVGSDMLKDGPVTMRAGSLVHLRSDFRFHLKPTVSLGTLVARLHPTPAVCGIPKMEAASFIAQNEQLDRRYYSGFAGPVDMDGETHLFVCLRCAELSVSGEGIGATLYAGGGIMPGSECLSEWLETEAKMKTIQNVLQ